MNAESSRKYRSETRGKIGWRVMRVRLYRVQFVYDENQRTLRKGTVTWNEDGLCERERDKDSSRD